MCCFSSPVGFLFSFWRPHSVSSPVRVELHAGGRSAHCLKVNNDLSLTHSPWDTRNSTSSHAHTPHLVSLITVHWARINCINYLFYLDDFFLSFIRFTSCCHFYLCWSIMNNRSNLNVCIKFENWGRCCKYLSGSSPNSCNLTPNFW